MANYSDQWREATINSEQFRSTLERVTNASTAAAVSPRVQLGLANKNIMTLSRAYKYPLDAVLIIEVVAQA